MNILNTVVAKELLDFSRDRKTLFLSLFMSPLLLLLLIVGLFNFVDRKQKKDSEKPLALAIVGAERAPNLVRWLAANGVTAKPVKDPDAAIRHQDEDVYLRIGDDYAAQWRKGEPALVEVVSDSTRQDARIPSQRLTQMLSLYGQQAGALRLLARGIDPSVATPVMVANRDLATPEARRGRLLTMMLPMLLIIGAFLGGAALITDMTAGERERQSLEPLLVNPASRGALVSGKVLTGVLLGMVSVLLTCLSFKLAAWLTPGIGRMMDMGGFTIVKLALVLAPLVIIGNALLTLIASGAKSVKEAQSYMSILMLLPMIPGYFLMVNPVRNALWQFAVPFLSQNQLILKVLRSEGVSATEWLVYFVCSLALAALLWWLAVRRYGQETLAIAG